MPINFLKEKFLTELKDFAVNNNKKSKSPDMDFAGLFKSVRLEEPKNKEFGDLTTNAAMVLSSSFGKKPMDLAQEIKKMIFARWDIIDNFEVMSPGFIN